MTDGTMAATMTTPTEDRLQPRRTSPRAPRMRGMLRLCGDHERDAQANGQRSMVMIAETMDAATKPATWPPMTFLGAAATLSGSTKMMTIVEARATTMAALSRTYSTRRTKSMARVAMAD